MLDTLLSTKLYVPQPHWELVSRPRLVERLDAGLYGRLTLVSAPAGYGKTTCLIQWARSSSLPVAWLAADEEDNDFGHFFRYLLAAWERVQPEVVESPLGTLLSGVTPDNDAVLAAFINEAHEMPDHLVFVLDDFHLIKEPTNHQALAFLLDHLIRTVNAFVLEQFAKSEYERAADIGADI